VKGRLQKSRFIVEMKRAHADARHPGYLFDCVSHRFSRQGLCPSPPLSAFSGIT
jgi:hypothetical protein